MSGETLYIHIYKNHGRGRGHPPSTCCAAAQLLHHQWWAITWTNVCLKGPHMRGLQASVVSSTNPPSQIEHTLNVHLPVVNKHPQLRCNQDKVSVYTSYRKAALPIMYMYMYVYTCVLSEANLSCRTSS